MHVAHPKVRVGEAFLRHRDETRGRIDTSTHCATRRRQLDGQPGPARHVQHAVGRADPQTRMERHILPTVGRLAQCREVDRASSPALIDHAPCIITRHDRNSRDANRQPPCPDRSVRYPAPRVGPSRGGTSRPRTTTDSLAAAAKQITSTQTDFPPQRRFPCANHTD